MSDAALLTPDALLMCTRSVRRRLDLSTGVPDALIRECVQAALQAPAGANVPRARFVVVRDPDLRSQIGGIYRDVYEHQYRPSAGFIGRVSTEGHDRRGAATTDSVAYLARHLGEVPVLVIACLAGGRVDGGSAMYSASLHGAVLPAMWSFMLAARRRSLGTCWTTMHLVREREVADLLGIPYASVQQVCLSPLAFTVGTAFRPAKRPDAEEVIHWDGWQPEKPQPPPYAAGWPPGRGTG